MELFGRRVRPLDAAVWGAGALALALAGYLAFAVVTHELGVREDTPVSREIDKLSALVKEQPLNVVARLQLAQSLSIAGREDEAVAQYRAVLQTDKDNVTALGGLGFIASSRRQWDTAEGYWQRIIEILEGRPESGKDAALETAYFYLGDVMLEQKRYAEAIPYYKAALRIKRDSSDTHYHLAVAYRETGAESKYQEELEVALAFDPKMPEANYDYGVLLLAAGDTATAAEHFRVSVDNAPAQTAPREALEQLGPASDRLAEAEKLSATDAKGALAKARIAAALDPKNAKAQVIIARAYEKLGDEERALEAWKRAVALDDTITEAAEAVRRLSSVK